MSGAPASAPVFAICSVRGIPNRQGRGFSLLRRHPDGTEAPWHIFVLRWDRKLYGYVNRCPHHGVNLDWERNQFVDGSRGRIVCGKHGSSFAVDTGECIDGPCLGGTLEAVRIGVMDGDICVIGVELADDDSDGLIA